MTPPLEFLRYEDITARWLFSTPLPADQATVEKLLEDIEDALIVRVPAIKVLVENGKVRAGTVRRVLAARVIDRLQNPEKYRSVSSGTGPFTDSATYGGDTPGEGSLTQSDIDEILGTVHGRQRAYSIVPRPRR